MLRYTVVLVLMTVSVSSKNGDMHVLDSGEGQVVADTVCQKSVYKTNIPSY